MQIIDKAKLDSLTALARANRRLRQNLNLHQSYDEPCQRLLNAIEPGSYVRPHRHTTPPKPETFAVLRGRLAVLTFDDEGEILRVALLGGPGEASVADIPAGEWHAVLARAPGSVFFEAKPGPYCPVDDKDWAPWAPGEGSAEAESYLARLQSRVREFREGNEKSPGLEPT